MNKASLVVLKHLVLFFNFAEFTRNANKIGKNDFIKVLRHFSNPAFAHQRLGKSNIPPNDNLDWNSPVRNMELLLNNCGWLWNKSYFQKAKNSIFILFNEMMNSMDADTHIHHEKGVVSNGSSLLYDIVDDDKVAKIINFSNKAELKSFVDDVATYYRNIRVQINNAEIEKSLK